MYSICTIKICNQNLEVFDKSTNNLKQHTFSKNVIYFKNYLQSKI